MAILVGCSCGSGNGNTGLPQCISNLGITIGNGIQQMVADDGTRNGYDLSASLGTKFVDSLTDTDVTKRMYPLRDFKNMDFPKEDTQYATNTDGSKTFLREGIQSFTAELHDVPAGFDSKLQNMKCKNNGVWGFSVEGAYGMLVGTMWYPININSFAPTFKMRTPAAPQMEMVAYDWDGTANAGQLWLVPWADLGTTYEAMLGLLDANFEEQAAPVAALGSTTVEVRVTTDYGAGLLTSQTVDGLITADFILYENGVDVTVASGFVATETVDDKYTGVYTQQTVGASMSLELVLSSGYEGAYAYTEPA